MLKLRTYILLFLSIQFVAVANRLQDDDYARVMAMVISQIKHSHTKLQIGIVCRDELRAKNFQRIFKKNAKISSAGKKISFDMIWEKNPLKSKSNILIQLDSNISLPKQIFSIATSKKMVLDGACLGIVLKNTSPTIIANRDSLLNSRTHFDSTFLRFINILKRRKQ